MNASLVLLVVVAAAGIVAGLAIGMPLGRRSSRDRKRVHELERQLDDAREEAERYRREVAAHFAETSDRLRQLTLQYRALYEHLAEGARALCPDAGLALEAGLAEPALPEEAARASGSNGSGAEREPETAPPAPDAASEPLETDEDEGPAALGARQAVPGA